MIVKIEKTNVAAIKSIQGTSHVQNDNIHLFWAVSLNTVGYIIPQCTYKGRHK